MAGHDSSGREPMSSERWARLEPLVDAALELPAPERAGYCDRISATDPALGAELRRLIAQAEETRGLLTAAAVERFGLLFGDPNSGSAEPDLLGVLQAALVNAYTLEREIGGGGMSRVFVAHEAGLGRKVVIKVLSPELAAGINADRFAREIRLAASLQQANIVPLLSTGTAAGHPYYTMPLVDGRSLRDRLEREGALPIADAVSILRDVARALGFAHARGVVHRDIKPGNVLLSGGTAVVTDFGIAKAIRAAASDADRPERDSIRDLPDFTLTEVGSSLGTPAYMAPEQAAGDPTSNHRADLYSFGCMAYEMFTGAPPFHGMPIHRVIAAHFNEAPRPLGEHRADVPPAIATMVMRCLEKDPARRPETAAHVLDALDARGAGEDTAPAVVEKPRANRKLVGAVTIVLAGVLTATAYELRHPAPAGPLTLAAIPFTNTAHDTALDYRSDGIRDEILTAMARVPGVQIIGRAAAYRFKNQIDGVDIRTVAHDLGVRFLVTGTLRENNGQVTISAQLNDSTTRAEVWADTFVRDSKDFGSIADDIVRTITDTLHARFGDRVGGRPRQTSAVGTANSDALDFYLLGQDQLQRRRVRQSVGNFERAIKLDPKFARAYASLATALQLYPYFAGTLPEAMKDTTIAVANRALGLDNSLAAPHIALGTAYAHSGRWADALAELRRGVDQDPGDVSARVSYARYLITIGRPADAIAQLKDARKVERVSSLVSAWLAYAYYYNGQLDSAIAESDKAIQDSTLLAAANVVSRIRLVQGKPDDARRVALAVPTTVMTYAPYVLAATGDTAGANRVVREVESRTPPPWYVDAMKATVQLAVGDTANALTSLERCARSSGPVWLEYFLLSDPVYDRVRQSPRFIALVRQANLDPGAFGTRTPDRR